MRNALECEEPLPNTPIIAGEPRLSATN